MSGRRHRYYIMWLALALAWSAGHVTAVAQEASQKAVDVDYEATLTVNTGDGDLAPYYIASGRGGTVTQQHGALARVAAWHTMDTTVRLSWGAGAELWGGASSSAAYERYDASSGTWGLNEQHPARAWVQQAYVEGKYRGVMAVLGQKRLASPLVNTALSSGDLIMSGNARPPAGLRTGFVNFQNIPLTQGWLQIAGEVGYYRLMDDDWLENHYNYYNHFVTTGYWLHYKNFYLRTRTDQPLVLTIGAQAACQFGGTATYYADGVATREVKMKADLKAFWRTMIAGSGGSSSGDSFVEGNHVGSWDIALDYKLPGGQGRKLRGYYQTIWEDGSGIGKMNGLDGLWGLEYASGDAQSWLTGVVVEWVDLTNQSGPIHWAPVDHEGTAITGEATGNDDYYNNYIYNGYQNRGLSIGSPFVTSPLYNRDGYMRYRDNVMRGWHVGLTGCITPQVSYRVLASHRTGWGSTGIPRAHRVHATSAMVEATYRPQVMPALTVTGQLAMDRGSLYGNNVGGLVSVTYHGNLTWKR